MKWSDSLISDIRIELDSAPHGKKRSTAEAIAERLSVSVATLYRKIDVTDGTKKCDREAEIPNAYIELIAKIKTEPFRYGVAGRLIATVDAIKIAEESGEVPEGLLTVATADRRLRELGYNQMRAYTRHEDKYVNQVHQLDFSRSEYFEVVERDGEMMVKVDGRRGTWEYKNKPKGERLRLWVCGYVDTYSRAYLVRYFAATGENVQMVAQFLQFAWGRKDEIHPFRHLPKVLKLDQGAVGKNAAFVDRMKKNLGVRVELAAPKNDRLADNQGMGKIERRFRTLWQSFELPVAFKLKQKNIDMISLEDLNVLAHQYAAKWLAEKHPVKSQTIAQVYETGLRFQEQRVLETDIFALLYTEDTRKVNSYGEISIENELYRVPEKYVGQRVKFFINPDGELRGADKSGRDVFDLIPVDPEFATGTKLHDETFKEEVTKEPVELAGASRLSLIGSQTPTAPQPLSLPHFEEEVEAETPFQAKPRKHAFSDWTEAKIYICEVFNCRWSDLALSTQGVFERLFHSEELTKEVIKDLHQTAS